jgi:hypothetical protein
MHVAVNAWSLQDRHPKLYTALLVPEHSYCMLSWILRQTHAHHLQRWLQTGSA